MRGQKVAMRVRIKATPKEPEIDGLSLKGLHPGEVRDVSPLVASWLIAEEYAEPEMRRSPSSDDERKSDLRWGDEAHPPEGERRRQKP
jgi:hypothetical protein